MILALENGEIVERGTHDQLLERNGLYRRTYDLQLRPQEEDIHGIPSTLGGDAR